ncbi:MAG TPA: hypothetical protein VF796_24120, partial [Humisphaera sp.]
MSQARATFVEGLEGRQFFAAQPLVLGPAVTGPVAWPSSVFTPVAKTPTTPTVGTSAADAARATSFVGEWTGTVKVKIVIISKKFDATFKVTKQTDTSLTGSIEIAGHSFSGTFTGKVNPATGNFTWEADEGDRSAKVTGNLSRSGTSLTGDIKAEYGGFSAKGS